MSSRSRKGCVFLGVIDLIAQKTDGKNFKTYKYSFDSIGVPSFDYDDNNFIEWKRIGENSKLSNIKDLRKIAKRIEGQKPLFTYFLDGSRRVFKVDDISYENQVFPIVAGQIGVGCCKRENKKLSSILLNKKYVIAIPDMALDGSWNKEIKLNALLDEVNDYIYNGKLNLKFTDIKTYNCKKNKDDKLENRGIAVIQDLMIDEEKRAVVELASKNYLNYENFLLKDGSLEYKTMSNGNFRELRKIKDNYRWVVGVSKSFNPEKCIDKSGKNNSNMIANLKQFCRTPVYRYQSTLFEGVEFGIWYVRIREKKYSNNPFDGVLKIEKILITEDEIENGLDSELVDLITANIINERNPVCYGIDKRWSNHLYPVFLTESYIKSKYISNDLFLNIF